MDRLIRSAATSLLLTASLAQGQPASAPLIEQDAAMQVSQHVYVIPDNYVGFVPNVGIVVGDRATLIIDTGLGERNGAIVLEEARKIAARDEIYLAATHFHPEHDLGAGAFPASARMVRWSSQQAENAELGADTIGRFSGISPAVAELLDGAEYRSADILFEQQVTLDLGGVHVAVTGVGPNHTRGDTVFFVAEDGVLFTGDVVMSVFPSVSAQYADLDKWLANLAAFEALEPSTIVPAHGRLGGVELVRRYREFLTTVRERVGAAKRGGASVDDTVTALAEELAAEFRDLEPPAGPQPGRIAAAVRAAYRDGT